MDRELTPGRIAIVGIAFGVPMAVLFGFLTGSGARGAVLGIAAGAMFAIILGLFTRTATKTTVFEQGGKGPEHDLGETMIRDGAANHFKGMESVGGKLYLTDRRLRFRAHTVNIQVHDESYPLRDVESAVPTRTLGIIPNGLLVTLADGRKERFVVYGNTSWAGAIQEASLRAKMRSAYRG